LFLSSVRLSHYRCFHIATTQGKKCDYTFWRPVMKRKSMISIKMRQTAASDNNFPFPRYASIIFLTFDNESEQKVANKNNNNNERGNVYAKTISL
jgi:hypothetical protein